jgi:hypothetical protein
VRSFEEHRPPQIGVLGRKAGSGTARPAAIISGLGGFVIGITPLIARSLVLTLTFGQSQTYLNPFCQALKEIREAQHHALRPRVLDLLCLGAHLLSAIAPMFRSELAHLLPPAIPSFYNLTRIPNRCTLRKAALAKKGLGDMPPTTPGAPSDARALAAVLTLTAVAMTIRPVAPHPFQSVRAGVLVDPPAIRSRTVAERSCRLSAKDAS